MNGQTKRFMAYKASIDDKLARLQKISDDHFNADPDRIDWGHVGTVAEVNAELNQLCEFVFGEGEHAGL